MIEMIIIYTFRICTQYTEIAFTVNVLIICNISHMVLLNAKFINRI